MFAGLPTSLEGTGSKQIHIKNYIRSSHPIHRTTSTQLPFSGVNVSLQDKNYTGHDQNNKGIERTTGIGKTIRDEPKLSLQNVCGAQKQWWPSPNIRSEGCQQVYSHKAFPTYIPCIGTGVPTDERLDDKGRYFKRIFSCAYRRIPPLLPETSLQQRTTTDDFPTLWPSISTTNICSSNELDCGNPAYQGISYNCLFGRLYAGPSGPAEADVTSHGGCESLGIPGLAHQLSKVHSKASASARISGDNLGYRDEHNVPVRTKSKKVRISHFGNANKTNLQFKTSTKNCRSAELRKFCGPKRSSALPLSPNIHEAVQGQYKNQAGCSTSSKSGSEMVATCSQEEVIIGPETIYSLSDNRRSCIRMGSPVKRVTDLGNLDTRTKEVALELEGAVRGICVDSESVALPSECSHTSTVRQSDTSILYPERGRNTLSESPKSDPQVVDADRQDAYTPLSTLPSGKVQLHRRPPVQGTASVRMAPVAHCNKPIIPSLGHSGRRLVRVRRNNRGQQVRFARLQRSVSSILKCLQSRVGLPSGLGLSSTQSNPSCSSPPKQCQRSVHNNSTTVGEDLLVSRPENTSLGATCDNTEPSRESGGHSDRSPAIAGTSIESTGLVGWRWGKQISSWSESEIQLLKSSWRQSTMGTYLPAIKRWLNWCNLNNINSQHPEIQQISRFLAYLHLNEKLAYSTILVHKSAILTFCQINESDDHLLLRQILKAIATAQPEKPRTPVWDPQDVFDWLAKPCNSDSLFEVSRRTAAILLLASGRRVHDLTLLRIADSNMTLYEDKIVLWPVYGSKTDSAKHRQSGWLLKKHPVDEVCPVKWVKRLIAMTQERRKEETDLFHLFISINGNVRPASRTVIGGWVRSVLRDAGISASPGSFRSAVASASWLENHPVDQILSRGNWKSENTFKKFYCREINKKRNDSLLLFDNFQTD